MADIVQQIQHPMIEEMQARYEVEIGEIKQQLQEKQDELDTVLGDSESSISSQTKFLKELVKDGDISLKELKDKIGDLRLARYEQQWDVISTFSDILDHIKDGEVRYETIEKVREVEILPASITLNGKIYNQLR